MMNGIIAMIIRLVTGARRCDPSALTDGPFLIVANHTSHFDFLVIWACLPNKLRNKTRPVAAQDYWTSGPIRRWLSNAVFHALLMNRKGKNTDGSHPLQPVINALDENYSVIIFPEGTRSLDGVIKPFKPGIYEIARRCPDIKIITVALDNLTRVLPKGEILPVPIIATAIFQSPTTLKENEDKKTFLERLQLRIKKQLEH